MERDVVLKEGERDDHFLIETKLLFVCDFPLLTSPPPPFFNFLKESFFYELVPSLLIFYRFALLTFFFLKIFLSLYYFVSDCFGNFNNVLVNF